VAGPTHALPPCAGAGLVQDLDRSWFPPPHDLVHDPKLLQLVYPPSTGHGATPQDLVSNSVPTQGLPPNWGLGLLQNRTRSVAPPPHDRVQVVNLLHEDKPPSIGHFFTSQVLVSVLSPTQSLPTPSGSGSVQVLSRVWIPGPHSEEQSLHSLYSDHPPSRDSSAACANVYMYSAFLRPTHSPS